MADIRAILEAERRGILPQRNFLALREARKRGLVPPLQRTGVQIPSPAQSFGEIRKQPAPGLGDALTQGIIDLPQGISNEIIAVGTALMRPIQTAQSFGMLAKGIYSSLTGGDEPEEHVLNAVVGDIKSRWGSFDQFKFALAEQPARILSELSIVIGGAAGLGAKAAKVSGITGVASALEKTAKIGRALDPVRLVSTPLTKAFSFVGKKIAGNLLTGSGDEFLERAYRVTPDKPRFLDALRGKIPMSTFLDDVSTSLTKAKDVGRNNYNANLAKLTNIDNTIPFNEIQSNFIKRLTNKHFNVKLDPSKPVGLNFADSIFSDARDMRTIRAIKLDIDRWAANSANQTGRGLDILKRRIDAKFIPSSTTRAISVPLRNKVKDTIVQHVKGYDALTAESEKFIGLLNDFQDVMSARSTSKANATLGKLTKLMRADNEFAQTIVKEMDALTGGQLIATASGLAGRKLTASATVGRRVQEAGVIMGLMGHADAKLGITGLMSSPRVLAEFLNVTGQVARGLQKTQQIIGASIPASVRFGGQIEGLTTNQNAQSSFLEP